MIDHKVKPRKGVQKKKDVKKGGLGGFDLMIYLPLLETAEVGVFFYLNKGSL